MIGARLRCFVAAVGLAAIWLKRERRRTLLAVVGVTLAVLAMTLLASVGFGVLETGEQKFNQSERDLWVTGGPLKIEPQMETPITNSLVGSHRIADELEERDDVAVATPMAFQAVYVGRNASDLRLLTGAGLPRAHKGSMVSISEGQGLKKNDPHYANGTYNGPMTNKVIIDPQTARLLNVSVGDQVYIGGDKASAREHRYTVVGISPTFSRFLGSKTVVLHLSELQELTGTTGTDRASFITVRLQDGVNPMTAQRKFQQAYPALEIRTNREQLQGLLGSKGLVIGSAIALVVLAVVSGLALTVNLLLLTVSQQRQELATLRAIGMSPRLLATIVGTKGLIIGGCGGAAGLTLTPISVTVLNRILVNLVGFESLLQTPALVYLIGCSIAIGIGTGSAIVAGWYLGRTVTLEEIAAER